MNEGAHTPMYSAETPRAPAGPAPEAAPPPSPAPPSAHSPAAPDSQLAPRCWRTVYLLLDLYANMPDADTITHRSHYN